MTIEMKKVWFDGEKVVTQNILESDIYKRHWDIASCKAYAEQLRDKNRANTAEPPQKPLSIFWPWHNPKQRACKRLDCIAQRHMRFIKTGARRIGLDLLSTTAHMGWADG